MRVSVLNKDEGRKGYVPGPVCDVNCFALVLNGRQNRHEESVADKDAVWSLSEAPLGKSQDIVVECESKAMSFSANNYLYLKVAQDL